MMALSEHISARAKDAKRIEELLDYASKCEGKICDMEDDLAAERERTQKIMGELKEIVAAAYRLANYVDQDETEPAVDADHESRRRSITQANAVSLKWLLEEKARAWFSGEGK